MNKKFTKALKWDKKVVSDLLESAYNIVIDYGGSKMKNNHDAINISEETAIEIIKTTGVGLKKTMNDKTNLTMVIIIASGCIAALLYKRTTLK